MSKLLNTLTAATILILSPSLFADDDDLFSDVKTKSVFENSATKQGSATSLGQHVTTPEVLRDLLKTAGFEVKVVSSQAVTLEKNLNPWTFPVMMVISEDEKLISIMLGLATIKDVAKELPPATLLKMMTASQENAPLLYSYHGKRERIELSRIMKNQDLTGLMLRDAVNQLALLAKKTSELWSTETAVSSAKDNTSKPETNVPTTPQPATSSAALAGKWSAAKSATEAFAVQLSSNGTFSLVYINNDKQVKSSGNFTIKDGSLSLVGTDGVKLEGKLTVKSDQEFTFEPGSSTPLVFRKAKQDDSAADVSNL